jgi:hypothetical protein
LVDGAYSGGASENVVPKIGGRAVVVIEFLGMREK